MTNYFYEHELQEHFRQRVARDLQLTRWGWFRRHEPSPAEKQLAVPGRRGTDSPGMLDEERERWG